MKEILNVILERAKVALQEDAFIPLVAFIKGSTLLAAFPMKFDEKVPSEENKSKNVFVAGVMARKLNADTVILTWDAAYRMVPAGTDYDETEAPLSYPKNMRTECLIIEGISVPSGKEECAIISYKGGDGEPVEFLSNDLPKDAPFESRFANIVLKGYAIGEKI